MTKITHYDYIVIGAGSAGSIVTSKLAASDEEMSSQFYCHRLPL